MAVLGADGVGKTSVAERIARIDGGPADVLHLDTRAVQQEAVNRVRYGRWADALVACRALILDGPTWLRGRVGLIEVLCELIRERSVAGRRTILCQNGDDGSVQAILGAMPVGSAVVVGLRFPEGRRGRARFGRRTCDELDIPRSAARGTEDIEPWRYESVIEYLVLWRDSYQTERDDPS